MFPTLNLEPLKFKLSVGVKKKAADRPSHHSNWKRIAKNTLTLASVVALFLLFNGCGDDDGPGGPSNQSPATPSSPSPSDWATNQPTSLTLRWTCSDPDGDPLTYDESVENGSILICYSHF